MKRVLEWLSGRGREVGRSTVSADVPDAVNATGVLARVTTLRADGRDAEAVCLLDQALRSTPGDRMLHGTLALALLGQGRLPEAETSMRAGIALDPGWSAGYNVLGVILQRQGQAMEARAAFAAAVNADEHSVDALANLANAEYDAGNLDAALRRVQEALALRPDFAALHVTMGRALIRSGRPEEAATALRQALVHEPQNAEALNDLGTVAQSQGDADGAEKCFAAAARLAPELLEPRINLASLLVDRKEFATADGYVDEVLALRPDHVEALNLRALVRKGRGDRDGAYAAVQSALALHPGNASLAVTLGAILADRGDFAGAEAAFRRALTADPASAVARYVVGTACLRRGEYREGFDLFNARFHAFKKEYAGSRKLIDQLGPDRLWRGEAIGGKRLAIWSEQGFGDCLMMARYLPVVQAMGASVTLVTYASLERLMRTVEGVRDVRLDIESLLNEDFTFHCPMLSLPAALKTQVDSVPPPPTFQIPPEFVAAWSRRYSEDRRPRVGLVWSGSEALRDNHDRNVPMALLAPLLDNGSYQFVSLQKNEASLQLGARAAKIADWMTDCRDFLDTAALVRTLDLVISVDTAVAHLAASLGVPTWLLNRHGGEWRWGFGRSTTPWYPVMRIFDQATPHDWTSTIADVGAALIEHLRR